MHLNFESMYENVKYFKTFTQSAQINSSNQRIGQQIWDNATFAIFETRRLTMSSLGPIEKEIHQEKNKL